MGLLAFLPVEERLLLLWASWEVECRLAWRVGFFLASLFCFGDIVTCIGGVCGFALLGDGWDSGGGVFCIECLLCLTIFFLFVSFGDRRKLVLLNFLFVFTLLAAFSFAVCFILSNGIVVCPLAHSAL